MNESQDDLIINIKEIKKIKDFLGFYSNLLQQD